MSANTEKESRASDGNPFRDLTKTFEQFKMSDVDMTSFVDTWRKDVQAMDAANKITYAALQALARTQTDMLTKAMQGMQETAKGMLASGERGGVKTADMAKHTEAAQMAWQKRLADMQALGEMVLKAQTDAVASLTERAKENLGAR